MNMCMCNDGLNNKPNACICNQFIRVQSQGAGIGRTGNERMNGRMGWTTSNRRTEATDAIHEWAIEEEERNGGEMHASCMIHCNDDNDNDGKIPIGDIGMNNDY